MVVVVCAISVVVQLVLMVAVDVVVRVVVVASHNRWRRRSIPHFHHLSSGLTGRVTLANTSDVQLGLPAGLVRGPSL